MANDKYPGHNISPAQRKFVELVVFHGWKYAPAVRECFKNVKKPSAVYAKSHRLRRDAKVKAYMDYCEKESMKEPERLLRKALRAAEKILSDPDHKQYGHVLNVISKLSGRLTQPDQSTNTNVTFRIEYED